MAASVCVYYCQPKTRVIQSDAIAGSCILGKSYDDWALTLAVLLLYSTWEKFQTEILEVLRFLTFKISLKTNLLNILSLVYFIYVLWSYHATANLNGSC